MFKLPKNTTIIFFGVILAVIFFADAFFYSNSSYAAVGLPWSSTYNCPDWTQGQALNCDGIQPYGGWTSSAGNGEQITAAANYPGGAGGKGQRHWISDGLNHISGGTQIQFSSRQQEIWIRWYNRWQLNFAWDYFSSHKILYIDAAISPYGRTIPIFDGWDKMAVDLYGSTRLSTNTIGWDAIMNSGNNTGNTHIVSGVNVDCNPCYAAGETHWRGDGQWHAYEVHLKMDTDGTNGIVEFWVDGIKYLTNSTANFGGSAGYPGFDHIVIGSNTKYPKNGGDMYLDYDDIAISTTGYIGPISGGDTTAPTQPTSLLATAQSASQINLTWAASTDNVGVAGYNIYRDGVQIATSTTTSYSNTGLTASTAYSYTVSAYDAAGNESGQSTLSQATTFSLPPPLKGDFNSDQKVNDLDFTSFKNAFKSIFNSIFDLNSDSSIDVKDLGVLMNSWLP